jgi:hypothetical protein
LRTVPLSRVPLSRLSAAPLTVSQTAKSGGFKKPAKGTVLLAYSWHNLKYSENAPGEPSPWQLPGSFFYILPKGIF